MNLSDLSISSVLRAPGMPGTPQPFHGVPAAAATGAPASATAGSASSKELEKAAKGFESILLDKLLQEMRNTIPDNGLFDNPVSKQLEGVFWSQLAQDIAEKGGLGLWKQIYRQVCPAAAPVQEAPRSEQVK